METPSSIRRVTRSQALAASANNSTNIPTSKKVDGTEKGVVKSKQRIGQDRSALFDITNDSPIVGLAMGSLETPSSYVSKRKNCGSISKNVGTPGSGEALLRGQVKTLLQKVEEEAEISKISVDGVNRPFHHGVIIGLPAPTPNNTPQVSNVSGNGSVENNGLESVTSSPVPEQFAFSQMVNEIFNGQQKKEESVESEKSLITRSLLFDFSEKSEGSVDSSSDCTSVLTYDGGSGASKVKSSTDDDDASIWSIQVNASTKDDEDDDVEDEVYGEEEDDYDEQEEEDYCDDDAILDDLCEGLSKVSVNGVEFAGKHTRFVYNSDDDLEGEEDCDAGNDSPDGALKLKGLPTPKGKHVRFPMED